MGPNRMWMFPVGFTTRRTNDVPQLFELRVVFVGCTGLEPQRSACTAHRATPAAPRRGPPCAAKRPNVLSCGHIKTTLCACGLSL